MLAAIVTWSSQVQLALAAVLDVLYRYDGTIAPKAVVVCAVCLNPTALNSPTDKKLPAKMASNLVRLRCQGSSRRCWSSMFSFPSGSWHMSAGSPHKLKTYKRNCKCNENAKAQGGVFRLSHHPASLDPLSLSFRSTRLSLQL